MWRLLAEIQAANVVFLAGVALACAVLLFRSQRRLRRQHASRTAAPSAWSLRDLSQPVPPNRLEAPLEMQRFEVQMHDMARETTARIDNKIRILEHLIRDADERIARLEAVGEWMDRSAKVDAGADGGPHAHAESGVVLSKLSAGSRGQAVSTANRQAESAPPTHAKSDPAGRSREEVYALADSGQTSAEVANRLNRPIGEVELILGLRQQQ
jgi:hypothetical protein